MRKVVRRVSPEEWQVWQVLRLEGLLSDPQAFGASYVEEKPYTEQQVRERLENNAVFGAWVEGSIVGTAGFLRAAGAKVQHRGVLFGMYVNQAYRGHGFSKALLVEVVDYAQKLVSQLHCTVVTHNAVAIKLYETHGFRIYGTEPRSLQIEGRFYDEHLMVKNL